MWESLLVMIEARHLSDGRFTYAFKIDKVTSDRTFSTRKEDKILAEILGK